MLFLELLGSFVAGGIVVGLVCLNNVKQATKLRNDVLAAAKAKGITL